MGKEENWIRNIRHLNVLPMIVSLHLLFNVLFGNGFWWTYHENYYGLLSIISIIGYVWSYSIRPSVLHQNIKFYFWGLSSVITMIWLILFAFLAMMILEKVNIFSLALGLFLVGYPLCMLYYNFRLFMNEISKM